MGTAILKKAKTPAAKKGVATKKAVVTVTIKRTINASPKTLTTVKAKKAAAPLIKKEHAEPVGRTLSLSAKPVNKQHALTKEELQKRQQAKSTSRKQGGAVYTALKEEQVKAMANIKESGPTKVS